mgnify:CR=1 FL=1
MNNFFFGIYPYIALSVLLIGSIARYERDPFTWKSSSSQLLRRKQLMLGSVLFHAGVIFIFFGHFFGLLVLTDPRIRATSSFWDVAILLLLIAQLALGLLSVPLSLATYEEGEVLKFMAWAQGIFTFRPDAAEQIAEVALIYKLHIVLGLTIFLVFPFTRLVHMLSANLSPTPRSPPRCKTTTPRRASPVSPGARRRMRWRCAPCCCRKHAGRD